MIHKERYAHTKENDYGMYSKNAGGHGEAGNRCRCASVAGIFTDAEWGIYGIDRSKLNADEKLTVEALETMDSLYSIGKEQNHKSVTSIYYTIKALTREFNSIMKRQGEEE
tara:strand:- start:808 stop:1140 length:333 start_codon:yes stop_codon:yes gene_type:complete